MGLFRWPSLAARSIRAGATPADKLKIACRFAIGLLYPVGILGRRVGRPLPDPSGALGEISVKTPAGHFVCPPGPAPFFLAALDSFEPALQRLLETAEGDVVDVGANVGFITVRAARSVARHSGQVIAIEPHPVLFQYLLRNVELNGLSNVIALNCAVGRADGVATLYDVDPSLGPRPIDVSLTPGPGRRYEVAIRPLDELLDDPQRVGLVKIDVEGHELAVLEGMGGLLARAQPLVVIEAFSSDPPSLLPLLPGYSLQPLEYRTYVARPDAVEPSRRT